ncbi:MAG: DUF4097 domain-containing protein [Lachnospiraceae bacterium]|nr:DUF4097 domain-containing protein [Ruminococcus sp.]MCM1274577.1 DUF4097 domain-containing protein [Lachnospiraceae bacterium]
MEKIVNKLLAVTFVFAAVFGLAAFLLRNTEHDSVAEDEREFELYEYIDVDLQRLDVTVIPYDGEGIRVTYKNDLPLVFEIGDNRLSITESTDFVVSLFAGREAEFGLYLYLPRRSFRGIAINTGLGDVKIGRIDSMELTVLTESGDILCEDMVSFGKLTTTSGYININFEYIVSGTEILSRRGDVDIALPAESSVSVDFQTDTGECRSDLLSGQVYGSRVYSFNGGDKLITAAVERGILTIV